MIDVEERVRRGLDALAAETSTAVVPPPVGSIVLRAGTEPARPRRGRRLAVAVAACVVVTTGVATATGVLPGPVESMLDEFRSWGYDANRSAERMARVTDDEITYEVWRAPLEGGGVCVYDRVIGPDGDTDHGGASHCHGVPIAPRSADRFGELHYPERVFDNAAGGDAESARRHSVSSGQLPLGATDVRFGFDDGTTLTVAGQHDGYFITTFPGVRDGLRIVRLQALDADGNVVTTLA